LKAFLALIVLAIALAFPAHANSTLKSAARIANKQNEVDGVPFRWEMQKVRGGTIMTLRMLPLPAGPSKADAKLSEDVLASISRKEQEKGRGSAALEEVRHMPDGGEVWILASSDSGIAYVIHFTDSPQGGVDIALVGPFAYSK
jgi:hypothetical protein